MNYNKNTFWVNTTATFELVEENDDFDTLLFKSVKEYSNRDSISHFNNSKNVFWIRYEDFAYRIAENNSYNSIIGDNCKWKLNRFHKKKYSIAKIEYKNCKNNI